MAMTYRSFYDKIHWTKRYVKHCKSGIRYVLRREKYKYRVNKRPTFYQIKSDISCKRKPYMPFKAQRRNYNTVYRRMQIPV